MNTALIGFGCVAGGFYEILQKSRIKDHINIKSISVKELSKERELSGEHFNDNAREAVKDENIQLVVEAIDDDQEAYYLAKTALQNGKHYVSANKKMIAHHLEELTELARQKGVSFLYEASSLAAVPVIRTMDQYFQSHPLENFEGIFNGSSNYILDLVLLEGKSFEEALQKAKEEGFAETDPTMDVDGYDALFKLVILIYHSFGLIVNPEDIAMFGIRGLSKEEAEFAEINNYTIRPIVRADKKNGEIRPVVIPAFLKKSHQLTNVKYENNGLMIDSPFSDKQLFVGKGAGKLPTGSAVFSDVDSLLRSYSYGKPNQYSEEPLSLKKDYTINAYLRMSSDKNLVREFESVLWQEGTAKGQQIIGTIALSKLQGLIREDPEGFAATIES